MLARCLASSSRCSAVASSSVGPAASSLARLSRRTIYSTVSRHSEDGPTSLDAPAASTSSESSSPAPPSSGSSTPKAPALFTVPAPGSRPKPRVPRTRAEPKANRLRAHLEQWPPFVEADDNVQDDIEKKIRKKVKKAVEISTTMAKWYSDPIPYLFPAPEEMFGVERMRKQTLAWQPRVGDRVRTPFNSYGTITALRTAAPRPEDPAVAARAAKKVAAAAAAAKAAAESKEGIDPTWGDKPAVAPDRKKHNIEMPPDWVLKTSKMGAYAGAVEKKLLQDEARRVAGGAKPRPVEEVLAGVTPSAKAEKEKMVAEVRVETEIVQPDNPRAHPVEDLIYAPLSQANAAALLAETSHNSIESAIDSGYAPSPADIITSSWGAPPPSSRSAQPSSPLRPFSQPVPKVSWVGTGVGGREGYLERRESEIKDLNGGGPLTGAERRLLEREKRKVWEGKKEKRVERAIRREGGTPRWTRTGGAVEGGGPRGQKWESFDDAAGVGGEDGERRGRGKGPFGNQPQREEKGYGM